MAKCTTLFNRLVSIIEDIDKKMYSPKLEKLYKEQGISTKDLATREDVRYTLQRAVDQIKGKGIPLIPHFANISEEAEEILEDIKRLSDNELELKYDHFSDTVTNSIIEGVCACEVGKIPLSDKDLIYRATEKAFGKEAKESR